MYMSKEKFDKIKAKHSTTIVVDADVGEALAFVQDLLEAEADAIKNRLWVEQGLDEYGAVQKDGTVDCGKIDAACADEIVQLALFGEVQFA